MELTPERAWQLALILSSGVPALEAMAYFFPDSSPQDRAMVWGGWSRSKKLMEAMKRLQGKDWHELSLSERLQIAIDKHYSELAYFLFTNNYAEVDGIRKTKSDTARSAIEAKLAGLSGQSDPLVSFWRDLKDGRVKLPAALPVVGQGGS